MSNQGPSYAQLAHQQLQQAANMVNSQGNPAIIQAVATLGHGLATLAQASETAKMRQAIEAMASVQVPPNTVPRHQYDEAIQGYTKEQARVAELQAQLRVQDKLDGEPVKNEG